eukprot:gene7345-3941_t
MGLSWMRMGGRGANGVRKVLPRVGVALQKELERTEVRSPWWGGGRTFWAGAYGQLPSLRH